CSFPTPNLFSFFRGIVHYIKGFFQILIATSKGKRIVIETEDKVHVKGKSGGKVRHQGIASAYPVIIILQGLAFIEAENNILVYIIYQRSMVIGIKYGAGSLYIQGSLINVLARFL